MNYLFYARLKRFLLNLVAVVLLVYVMFHAGACRTLTPIGVGFRAVTYVAKARDIASKALKAACLPKMEECFNANPEDQMAYLACMERNGCDRALQLWGTILTPAIQASLQVTIAALETARIAKKTHDWKKTLKPAACGLYRAAVELKPLLGKTVGKILEALSLVGLVCGGGK